MSVKFLNSCILVNSDDIYQKQLKKLFDTEDDSDLTAEQLFMIDEAIIAKFPIKCDYWKVTLGDENFVKIKPKKDIHMDMTIDNYVSKLSGILGFLKFKGFDTQSIMHIMPYHCQYNHPFAGLIMISCDKIKITKYYEENLINGVEKIKNEWDIFSY